MNHELEVALAAARRWRDIGNAILLLAVLIEFAIDGFWPEPIVTFPLLCGRKATQPLSRWREQIFTLRNITTAVAGLAVALGIGMERIEGNKADDLADQIRTNLQERLIQGIST